MIVSPVTPSHNQSFYDRPPLGQLSGFCDDRKMTIANRYYRAPVTGLCVGLTDVAFVFPLAVVATRRECGDSLKSALQRGRLWSGAMTAGTMLIPYSISVESLSSWLDGEGGSGGVGLGAVLGTTAVTALGVQPIEKKLVMDQMLQTQGATTAPKGISGQLVLPMKELLAYTRMHGIKALFGGFLPLMGREFCYIAAITAVNPAVTGWLGEGSGTNGSAQGVAGAFAVGACAGIVSAPLQTLSAMQKSESHRGVGLQQILKRHIFCDGALQGMHRLFFGAAIRSCRTGCAGVLYYSFRTLLTPNNP